MGLSLDWSANRGNIIFVFGLYKMLIEMQGWSHRSTVELLQCAFDIYVGCACVSVGGGGSDCVDVCVKVSRDGGSSPHWGLEAKVLWLGVRPT